MIKTLLYLSLFVFSSFTYGDDKPAFAEQKRVESFYNVQLDAGLDLQEEQAEDWLHSSYQSELIPTTLFVQAHPAQRAEHYSSLRENIRAPPIA